MKTYLVKCGNQTARTRGFLRCDFMGGPGVPFRAEDEARAPVSCLPWDQGTLNQERHGSRCQTSRISEELPVPMVEMNESPRLLGNFRTFTQNLLRDCRSNIEGTWLHRNGPPFVGRISEKLGQNSCCTCGILGLDVHG